MPTIARGGRRAALLGAADGRPARLPRWWAARARDALAAPLRGDLRPSRRTALDLTYYTHGDRRQRGLALLALRRRYAEAGLELEGPELPDHLPVMLEFAALDPGPAGALLAEYRPVLELVRMALERAESPYAGPARRALPDAAGAAAGRARGAAAPGARGPARRGRRARALRPARGDARAGPPRPRRVRRRVRRGRAMSRVDLLLWVVLPYAAMTVFVAGHIWRYRHDQFGWTTRSTQLLESRRLRPAVLAVPPRPAGRHRRPRARAARPASVTARSGCPRTSTTRVVGDGGHLSGLRDAGRLRPALARRETVPRARHDDPIDRLTYLLLGVMIVTGMYATVGENLLGGGYDYRETVAPWFRGLFILDPDTSLIAGAPLVYRIHAATAWLLYALWPFSRLVHAWSVPVAYLGRSHILYRSRRRDRGAADERARAADRRLKGADRADLRAAAGTRGRSCSRRSPSPSRSTRGACWARWGPTCRTCSTSPRSSWPMMIAVPVLMGSLMRIPLGILTDRIGGPAGVHRAAGVHPAAAGRAGDLARLVRGGHRLRLLSSASPGASFAVGVPFVSSGTRRAAGDGPRPLRDRHGRHRPRRA